MSSDVGPRCAPCHLGGHTGWVPAQYLWVVSEVSTYPLCATHYALYLQQVMAAKRPAPLYVKDVANPHVRYLS